VLGTFCILLAAYLPASGDPTRRFSEGKQSTAPLFSSTAPLAVTIEAPLTTLMRDRPDEEYLGGTLSVTGDNGTEHVLDLKIRTRGKYRRGADHCDFAPIRLNFRKQQVIDTIFSGQDKLKVVAHCQTKKPYYEQLVLREFLAYRLFNLMTTNSYSVRLLQIRYIDTEGEKEMTKVGFVIEDDDDVASRNDLQVVKTGDISSDDLDRGQQNLVNVFQYLLGNTEYSLSIAEPDDDCCHNSDLMSATGESPFIPLPYDFDFAGIVNAPYAEPNPRYKLKNVRQRLYKGLCKNNDLLPKTLQQFIARKDAMYGVVDELELLRWRSRRDVTRYMNRFFDQVSQPKYVEARFVKRCIDQ